jgi:hypothetical protein
LFIPYYPSASVKWSFSPANGTRKDEIGYLPYQASIEASWMSVGGTNTELSGNLVDDDDVSVCTDDDQRRSAVTRLPYVT